jgi:hypothetical protein
MTLAHFVYIPGILLVGIVIGWVLGARAAALARRDASERDDAARARALAKAARERARAPVPGDAASAPGAGSVGGDGDAGAAAPSSARPPSG